MSKVDHEKWQEVALVDISYEVLNQANKTMNYRDIFKEAANWKGLTDDELMELLPQVFTEMNLDGRYICLSPSEWGLKKWYTTEQIEESIEALARSKGIDDSDDDYGFEDEEEVEEDFTEDGEDIDGEEEDLEVDEDEEEDVDLDETDDELSDEFEDEEDPEYDVDAVEDEEEYLEDDDAEDDSEKDD